MLRLLVPDQEKLFETSLTNDTSKEPPQPTPIAPMQLLFSTPDLTFNGFKTPQFPLLINRSGELLVVVLLFLRHILIENPKVQSSNSWQTYGRSLYDFFLYLENKDLAWNEVARVGSESVISGYRSAAKKEFGNTTKTINQRVRLIAKFYEWAFQHAHISSLPADLIAGKNSLYYPEQNKGIVILQLENIASIADLINSNNIDETHGLIYQLALECGLRSEEIITFPKQYVIDTNFLPQNQKRINVKLDPRHMTTKRNKERIVPIPVRLMTKFWQYLHGTRPGLLSNTPMEKMNNLFLSRHGAPFSRSGLYSAFLSIGKKVGVHSNPHILRHTFATYWLLAYPPEKRIKALFRLKNILGHASITTTETYIHLLDEFEDQYVDQYQSMITKMFTED